MPSRRRRSARASARPVASSAPARSPRRCSRSFATSIHAWTATAPGPAARSSQVATASSWRPRRRRSRPRSIVIRSVVHGESSRPVTTRSQLGRGRRPPTSAVRRGCHHGSPGGSSDGSSAAASSRAATTAVAGRGPGRGSSAASRQPRASSRRPARPKERASPARSPIGWRSRAIRVRVVHVDPAEQPGEGADVLVVVADDVDERPGVARRAGSRGTARGSPSRRRRRGGSARAAPSRRSAAGRPSSDGGRRAGRTAAGRGGRRAPARPSRAIR